MQKMVLIFVLLTLQSGLLLAQQTREEKLEQLKQRDGVKVTEAEKNIIKIEYPNGKTILKNMADYKSQTAEKITYSPTFDSTIIDLTTIDTTLYYQKYELWQKLPITNSAHEIIEAADINNNGKIELYGYQLVNNIHIPVSVFELQLDNYFQKIYTYPDEDIIAVRGIYDIDKDGNLEVELLDTTLVLIDSTYYLYFEESFYEKSHPDSLATRPKFSYAPYQGIFETNFGDFDGDSLTDIIYLVPSKALIQIAEYSPLIINFGSVYTFRYGWPEFQNLIGFGIGDFDKDGFTEFVSGDLNGKILIIENQGNNSYDTVWVGEVPTNNAYFHATTNDINGNGKPEFWVMGDHFDNEGDKTVISVFEAANKNEYQIIGIIYLLGVFSWSAGNIQALDVDNDGIEEMLVCIDDNVLILKYKGNPHSNNFELFYIQKSNGRIFLSAASYYLLNKSEPPTPEFIVTYWDTKSGTRNDYTDIYVYSSITQVNDNIIENDSAPRVSYIYPNPFNHSTKFTIKLTTSSKVVIKVFNVLGKEIQTILNERLTPAEYEITWNLSKENLNLPSGVYFINVSTNNYQKNKKVIYIK